MTRLGADLAMAVAAGDVLALSGDLGAGKSTLARALIRALAGDPDLDVPSPTFTLVQDYQARLPVLHADLYRIGSPDELDELGLDEAAGRGVVLVEWPERAEGNLPGNPIVVVIEASGEGRRITFDGPAATLARFQRTLAIRAFLQDAGQGEAQRSFMFGDASTRAYETITQPHQPTRILMDAPKRPDGPVIRDGKPYSQIAHLAESVTPFVAVGQALYERGMAAPAILAQDLDEGLLLIEHLGSGNFLHVGEPVAERYHLAAQVLAAFHAQSFPDTLPVGGDTYRVPSYDREALHIETELLIDWYLPSVTGKPASDAMRADYHAAWSAVFDQLDTGEKHLVIRDYHSPNLIWRPEQDGLNRIGVIDFQDALIGPSAYDVASLAMDARVDIAPALEASTKAAYVAARQAQGAFDVEGFERAYAVMAAQRNAKILGIFVRLNERDGKPVYLKHLPRIRSYFARALGHPALQPVRRFVEDNGILASTDAQ
ncbi:tRNA (adenosine(37)-N6)-threonylcarbamoyltransferase complex ATPase subunit type 1 TsaE [Tianweitania sp. BSSL-BM11]|uniref:tRNA threonylcarbamoyladenosine biosynthesis protein TsaE n=1 Tax=Tianweitania aestuarii TaxID=2814886 RepID=A0ABS5RXB1_9HYPH|nr:tRNA (adenosine(37)-N6)-threonylcarbamoyltransferase complex ATPase subunit type 1 TsaE [Tianweitania aestuarii]MBS9721674.1 tRNA (adenosine(37)-N6)-threonylcarbamoyltransferase complex ATPase subunit type 1 TsaE [Tianweitania aestuarii]